jgi:cholesterol transport system auxiliary component
MLLLSLAGGCSLLQPSATPPSSFYALDGGVRGGTGKPPVAVPRDPAAPTLIVNPMHAAAGYDSAHILYQREAHKLEHFAHSEWVDTPARMLMPPLVGALEATGVFRAVVVTPSAAAGDVRMDTEVIRLQHDFTGQPSGVRFTLRAYLVDNNTRRVLVWREFDGRADATSADPYGGVVAANQVTRAVLAELALWGANAARNLQPEKPEARP